MILETLLAVALIQGEPKNMPPFVRPREVTVSAPASPAPEPSPSGPTVPAEHQGEPTSGTVSPPPPPPSSPVGGVAPPVTPPPGAVPAPTQGPLPTPSPSASPVLPTSGSPQQGPVPVPPAPARHIARGVVFECNHTESSRVMPLLQGLEVRLQVWAELLDTPGYIDALDRCLSLAPTLLIVNSLTTPPDLSKVAEMARRMSTHNVIGIEVLNEADQYMSVQDYNSLLCAAYAVIGRRVPVLNAGTTFVPLQWIAGLNTACFDALSVHPYATGLTAPAPSGLETLTQAYALVHKPVWVTEIGWSLPDAEQAQQTAAALDYLETLPFVSHVFFFQAYPSWFDNGLWDGTSLIHIGTFTPRPALSVLRGY